MNNWNLYDQKCFTVFMHTYAYLELFKSVFSLNKQIFQLFQFIWAILRLLNHARRLKFSCCCCWCWWQHWHWSSKQTPPDKKIKNVNFNREKHVWKALKLCTYRFLGVPIAMHYVRTLCDKYFLSCDGPNN